MCSAAHACSPATRSWHVSDLMRCAQAHRQLITLNLNPLYSKFFSVLSRCNNIVSCTMEEDVRRPPPASVSLFARKEEQYLT